MIANPIDPVHSAPMRILHLLTLSLFAAAAFADDECPPRFCYCGYSGPAQWPNIAIKDKKNECGGDRQSPINLPRLTPKPGPTIQLTYVAGDATIRNTGHDIEVTPTQDNNKIEIDKKVYTLVKFHFHVRSEHHIGGSDAPAEIHFVHQLEGGTDYAVIGVLLTSSATPTLKALAPVFANLPEVVCAAPKVLLRINFDQLFPEKLISSYYTYAGSLTTPPCTQSVTWFVLDFPRTVLESDLTKLRAFGANARPIQSNRLPVTYVRPK
jgi:carbonic anhydrase